MIRTVLIGILVGLGLIAGCKYPNIYNSPTVRQIPVDTFAAKIATDTNAIIIDVRTPLEYEMSHIDKAVNISYVLGNFKTKVSRLDTTKTVYLYCQTAHRSPFATQILKDAGFTQIYDLKKGYKKWKKRARQSPKQ